MGQEVRLMGLRPNGDIIIFQPQQLERRVAQLERENQRQQREIDQLQRRLEQLNQRLRNIERTCCGELDPADDESSDD
jgi:predicted  nucleic acid-binding Zn-ribbon protein